MTEAAGIYNEAESAAAYVLHLVRDKGLRYRDIRLIYNDLENRGDIIERVFEEYGIELFSDVKRDIMDSPIIKYITSLLDVVIENTGQKRCSPYSNRDLAICQAKSCQTLRITLLNTR